MRKQTMIVEQINVLQMGPKEEERPEALALARACSLISALDVLSPRCPCTCAYKLSHKI